LPSTHNAPRRAYRWRKNRTIGIGFACNNPHGGTQIRKKLTGQLPKSREGLVGIVLREWAGSSAPLMLESDREILFIYIRNLRIPYFSRLRLAAAGADGILVSETNPGELHRPGGNPVNVQRKLDCRSLCNSRLSLNGNPFWVLSRSFLSHAN